MEWRLFLGLDMVNAGMLDLVSTQHKRWRFPGPPDAGRYTRNDLARPAPRHLDVLSIRSNTWDNNMHYTTIENIFQGYVEGGVE